MNRSILKSLLFVLACTVLSTVVIAQVPQGFNYMAIARDVNEDIIPDEPLDIYIAILDGDLMVLYDETHAVTTSATGLFKIIIGQGTPLYGGAVAGFGDIDWKMQPLYVKTIITFRGEDLDLGHTELLSVPYAMVSQSTLTDLDNPFAMNADTIVLQKSVDVVGSYGLTEEEALFEVKRQDGQTMFAVYNQGVRINIPMDDAIKGAKGGFAIGGFSGYKGTTHNLFVLNKDSARIFIDQSPDLLPKGAKGGFAIGGFAYATKADVVQDYLYIAPDQARIYVKDPAKGAKGGFAIGSLSGIKAVPTNFMDVTPLNYFIGHESGTNLDNLDPGSYNSAIGYQAGKNITTGDYNTILGNKAGTSLNTGSNNIIVGDNAGFSMTNAYSNTLIGYRAGNSLTDQSYNVFVGHESGMHVNSPGWNGGFNAFFGVASGWAIRTSRDNTFLGINAGMLLDNGTGNVFIGTDAGRAGPDVIPWVPRALTSSNNTFIGTSAGYNNSQGNENVAIGYSSGSSLQTGSGNVFLGYTAGSEETGSNKLYITNRTLDGDDNPITPLLYGDFSTHQLGINSTSLTATLNVGGSAYISGNLSAGSITAPVTGTLTGNVNGDLTGNVKGDVEGDLTGSVNGVETGKIERTESSDVQFTAKGAFRLYWEAGDGMLIIFNDHDAIPCEYWYRKVSKAGPEEGSGTVLPRSAMDDPIYGVGENGTGVEVHFGYPNPDAGYCSVWVHFIDGVLVGHYIKY